MNEETKKIKVAQKSFNGLNFLTVSCYIEERNIIKNDKNYIDVVFLEMTPEYVANKKEVMLLSSMDLRSMSYAIKETLKHGVSPYKKYTDPQKTGGKGSRKELSFAQKADRTPTYYLNMSTGGKTIAFSFDTYNFASFADILTLMAEETEKALYHKQRGLFSIQYEN